LGHVPYVHDCDLVSLDHAVKVALANMSADGLPRMGAVIYRRRRLISIGQNSRRSHPLQARYGRNPASICIHAEIAALANARESVAGAVMFVARVFRDGKPALAQPCSGCQRAIAAFGLSDVEWTENG
jgi:deoxycytidylate deaminase